MFTKRALYVFIALLIIAAILGGVFWAKKRSSTQSVWDMKPQAVRELIDRKLMSVEGSVMPVRAVD